LEKGKNDRKIFSKRFGFRIRGTGKFIGCRGLGSGEKRRESESVRRSFILAVSGSVSAPFSGRDATEKIAGGK
jgi:hypothetical protein